MEGSVKTPERNPVLPNNQNQDNGTARETGEIPVEAVAKGVAGGVAVYGVHGNFIYSIPEAGYPDKQPYPTPQQYPSPFQWRNLYKITTVY